MAKLFKHFGLGGSNKKTCTHEFQAKTLPSSASDRSWLDDGLRGQETPSTAVDSLRSKGENFVPGRRASHESYSTMPTHGVRMCSDRDWSLRAHKTRDMTLVKLFNGNTIDANMHTSKCAITDSKELRRSFTSEQMLPAFTMNGKPPTVGEYSDPFDLKKVEDSSKLSEAAESPGLPLLDDDYSVPYEQKGLLKGIELDGNAVSGLVDGELELVINTPSDVVLTPRYDDPYEENPLVLQSRYTSTDNTSVEAKLLKTDVKLECKPTDTTSKQQKDLLSDKDSSVLVKTRSFELSDEYGGFFIPTEQQIKDIEHDPENYTDLQAQPLNTASLSGVGLYDEPWDLSTTQRGFEQHLKVTHQQDTIKEAQASSSVVYALPRKADEQQLKKPATAKTDPRDSSGPSYGVLCEKISPPPPRQHRCKVTTRTSSDVDNRPGDDYDVPWDQKKLNFKEGDPNCPSGCASSHSRAEQDPKQSLDTQMWYHGSISRRDAENLLRMRREGSFLVRTSESNRQDFSLSVRSMTGFMHMKIVTNPDGRYILGQFSQPFYSIAQMVHYYTLNKLPIKGAEHISLSTAVSRELL